MMDIDPSRPDAQQTSERPLNLSDFAQRNQITEDRVWELIEEGELAARFVNDEILILREQDTGDEPQIDLQDTPTIAINEESEVLPKHSPVISMETAEASPAVEAPRMTSGQRAMPEAKSPGKPVEEPLPDFFAEQENEAFDDNNLPPDDYRDLLVFAQDAMNRTMDLSRQLLGTKDELIRMKNERIEQLQMEQQRNEHEIRRLRKKVEDLETLCRLTPNP
jgi:hypothetical protein